jgi:thymidylate synthase
MLFPPCHYGFQVSTRELSIDERLVLKEKQNPGKNPGYELGRSDDYYESFCDNWDIPKRSISLLWNQRSVDSYLGLPFNIASYAMLLMMFGQVVNMVPEDLICSLGDTHIYKNHIEQAKLQISREPYALPQMKLNRDIKNIDDFKFEDFELINYVSHPHIKADISI